MAPKDKVNLILRETPEIHFAIVGMGKMGGYHLQSLQQLAAGKFEEYYKGDIQQQLNKIRIVGICDIDEGQISQYTGIATYTDYDKMLDCSKPDIIIIASPTTTHFQYTKKALEKGCHAFVEKPIVTRTDQIHELVNLADTRGLRLMSGHVERYNPVSITIKSIQKEKFFTPVSYSFVRMQRHDARIADDIIVDKVIHDLDLSLYFFGEIENAEVEQTKLVDSKVFQAAVDLQHKNGITGRIFVSWLVDSDDKTRQVTIRGEENQELFGDFYRKKLLLDGREVECSVPGWIKPDSNQIKDELVDFIFYCTEPAETASFLKPLLSMEEILHGTKYISEIIKQTA